SMVHRLRQGALGHRAEQRFPVLICIDELDKVVDFEEIRAFVRRIKAIFEVPGVYYYVSLAEDTLTALYLGPAEGKNEIDSAFDHIVRIPALSCDAGEAIASEYLVAHGLKDPPAKLTRLVSTVSFGVPRDIIRRCDEVFAAANGNKVGASHLVKDLRAIQLAMGYELKQLAKSQIENLDKGYAEAARYAQSVLKSGTADPTQQRLMLSIWLLSLIEGAVELSDGEQWKQVTEEICNMGYKLPTDSIPDLLADIELIHMRILGRGDSAQAAVSAV